MSFKKIKEKHKIIRIIVRLHVCMCPRSVCVHLVTQVNSKDLFGLTSYCFKGKYLP